MAARPCGSRAGFLSTCASLESLCMFFNKRVEKNRSCQRPGVRGLEATERLSRIAVEGRDSSVSVRV